MYNFFPPFNNYNSIYSYPKMPFFKPEHGDSFNDSSKNKFDADKADSLQQRTPVIEFNGIKLFNDDLLILILIYFFYKEHINDKLLLVALFSLLF